MYYLVEKDSLMFLLPVLFQTLQKASEVSGGDSSDDDDIFAVLEIDAKEAETALAENWGFVFSEGMLSVIGGFVALLLPVYSSAIAYNAIMYTLGVVGFYITWGACSWLRKASGCPPSLWVPWNSFWPSACIKNPLNL